MWKCYEKPVNKTVKKHVNCSISHVFSHGFHTFFTGCETIETLWTGHFSQGQNLCETLWKTLFLTCENTCERPGEKNLLTFTVFITGWKISKPVNRPFFMVRTCGKNSEMGGVYLAAVCCQPPRLRPPEKNTMLKSDFCSQVK